MRKLWTLKLLCFSFYCTELDNGVQSAQSFSRLGWSCMIDYAQHISKSLILVFRVFSSRQVTPISTVVG